MIDTQALLRDLKRLIRQLEGDLREVHARSDASRALEAEWREARDAGRTAQSFDTFKDDALTQSAVHWILGCVFLRFIEDNGLVERPWLAGPGERMHLARDRQAAYFRARPHDSDLDYLLACFDEAAVIPGLAGLFDREHNPLFRLLLSGDGAMALLGFFQRIDPDTGALVHDFTHPEWGWSRTRFLGDLYQDLSEAARKRYALLQTPEFVESFILERTLDPAIREFGFRDVRLIDPTCGSGHFLLGAFERLNKLWAKHEPGLNPRAAAQKTLDSIAGVDINPFAAEIARFRLLLAALGASEIQHLKDAPDFRIHVAIGDSLLHGRRFGRLDLGDGEALLRLRRHRYAREDNGALSQILGRPYHAVVANPPYITPKDAAENQAYRALYHSCHGQYALTVPFIERCFDLAVDGRQEDKGGFVGLIVSNSFMKREFGKKVITDFLPTVDLTHVVDTSGAHIPGHGTPTVLLFGRSCTPVEGTVRTVMGIKGEPGTPVDPAKAPVWSAIRAQVDRPGSESEFVSAADTPRDTFAKHPWLIGGGGATNLQSSIEERSRSRLSSLASVFGGTGRTSADDVVIADSTSFSRKHLVDNLSPLVEGDQIRDWRIRKGLSIITPYDEHGLKSLSNTPFTILRWLWPYRTNLSNRMAFGYRTYKDEGRPWWSWHQISTERLQYDYFITFAFVATHNHFALDRGGKVFKQSAPIIKLPPKSTERDYLSLLGLLNSSTACFWLQQVCHNKGGPGGASSKDEKWHDFYEFNGANVAQFPVARFPPTDIARKLDVLGREFASHLPGSVVRMGQPSRYKLDNAYTGAVQIRRSMISLQEELDWRCYYLYGLVDEPIEHDTPPLVDKGQRAFEIFMAREMNAGRFHTRWFEWLEVEPCLDPPQDWPQTYKDVVERRIEVISCSRQLALIESPNCKRRWEWQTWEDQEQEALRDWLLNRLEDARYWSGKPQLLSTNRLADLAAKDPDFRQVAELYAGRPDIELSQLVETLVVAESVPFLPVLRYTEAGLRKRAQWERTWELQRKEDDIDAEVEAGRLTPEQGKARKHDMIGDIPVPPKYKTPDFQKTSYWRLRGGLDVPKERFVIYPYAEREADGSPVVSWAGFDHLQQAQAIATYYLERKDREGWSKERLVPLLADVAELLPWLQQWHNAYDSAYGMGMGDYFMSFVDEEARALGTTPEGLTSWTPPEGAARRSGRRRRESVE